MSFKNKTFIYLFIIAYYFNSVSTIHSQDSNIALTLEEVQGLIKQMNEKWYDELIFDKTLILNPNLHSSKGLKKIVACVNNFANCDHPVLTNKNGYRILQKSPHLNVKEIERLKHRKVSYDDLYNKDDYNQLKDIVYGKYYRLDDVEKMYELDETIKLQTKTFFTHLLFYLKGKKTDLKN